MNFLPRPWTTRPTHRKTALGKAASGGFMKKALILICLGLLLAKAEGVSAASKSEPDLTSFEKTGTVWVMTGGNHQASFRWPLTDRYD